jgi:hypothetical protein
VLSAKCIFILNTFCLFAEPMCNMTGAHTLFAFFEPNSIANGTFVCSSYQYTVQHKKAGSTAKAASQFAVSFACFAYASA